jgi:membrane protein implicated in regulation of membrane protease activity
MYDLFFNGGAGWFSVVAIVGTLFFALRLVLLVTAGHGAHDLALDMGDAHHGDPGEAFKALSIQSIAAFAMGFGWGGLGALKGAGWDSSVSLLIAAACGVAMVWILALLLKGIHDLQSSGNIAASDAIGLEGDVYVTVPARGEGRGQVRIVINNRQRIYDAESSDASVATAARVRVVGVNQDQTLTVSPI